MVHDMGKWGDDFLINRFGYYIDFFEKSLNFTLELSALFMHAGTEEEPPPQTVATNLKASKVRHCSFVIPY